VHTNNTIKQFNTREDIHKYLVNTFSKPSDLVLIRGSTAFGKIRSYSDFDVEIYSKSIKNPFYEIIFYKNHPVLLTIYFYSYSKGKDILPPKNLNVLQGVYNDKIEEIFQREISKEGQYNGKDLIARKCQLNIDFFFKFMRSKDSKFLEKVNNRLRME
jgi:hypothetical protein